MINPLLLSLLQVGGKKVKHAIFRTVSMLCVIGVILLLGLGVKRIINPPPTQSYAQVVEEGGQNYNIEVYNPEDDFFLGVRMFGLKFGISKPNVKKISDITKEADVKKD